MQTGKHLLIEIQPSGSSKSTNLIKAFLDIFHISEIHSLKTPFIIQKCMCVSTQFKFLP